MPISHLNDRGVLKISGEEAEAFLNGLLTIDVSSLNFDQTSLCALLSPQGKILFDAMLFRAPDDAGGGFYLDCLHVHLADLINRLTFYKLRAKVTLDNRSEQLAVLAGWNAPKPHEDVGLVGQDLRLNDLGWRAIVARDDASLSDTPQEAYHAHRIDCAIPEGGKDFLFGQAFPHDVLMDQINGVDFQKGCYVGQEVVSRMQHRGQIRTRIMPVLFADNLSAEAGIEVMAGPLKVGTVGTSSQGKGLAMLRLDRVRDAMNEGVTLTAGGVDLQVVKAPWMMLEF